MVGRDTPEPKRSGRVRSSGSTNRESPCFSCGECQIWYKFETWSPGYTNYYWKIKVNGKAVTGRYIKINGKTYDCYDGNF